MSEKTFSLDELARLVNLDRRTIRYYIQIGLIPRPIDKTRAARYDETHVERLLRVKALREAGLSLERIAEAINFSADNLPAVRRRYGTVQVRSHIAVCSGIEVSISPDESILAPEEVRELISQIAALAETFNKEQQ
ncbi:MAG: helix-turn-helix domain-containing protein [Campylobacteraceae bacterium]|jgi:DNA-binding transcriptional MerR regulator|nr:helix-turn-helix domain-containing protein [Campylobacteraceae bacterium]